MPAEHQKNADDGISILLSYKGPSVDDGTMSVYDVAKNMVAFSDYVVEAAHAIYGKDVEVTANVQAFQHGSFVTDLVFHVVGIGATIIAATPDVGGVVSVVKESLELFKFLKGEAPSKIEHHEDRSVHVTNNNGNVTQVNIASLHITLNSEIGAKAAKVFVGDALSKSGVDQIAITSAGELVASATSSEAGYFHPIENETPVLEQTYQTGLTIQEPSFKDGSGHKWTMWDGEVSLQFAMEDPDFIARIDSGERFGKGDILICDVRVTQTKTASKLKSQRTIIKVHDHQVGPEQSEMDM